MIYALVDPRTDQWRYIGKSEKGLQRTKELGYPSFLRRETNTHKKNWIEKLQNQGLSYKVEILEIFDSNVQLCSAEMEWIAEAKRCGIVLLNRTDGGEGLSGRKKSESERSRISLSNMESKRTLTEDQETEMCHLYILGMNSYELSKKFKMERHTVVRWLRKNGVDIRPKTLASRRKISDSQLEEMGSLYKEGWSTLQIASKYNTVPSNIHYNLKILEVKMRSHSEAAINAVRTSKE